LSPKKVAATAQAAGLNLSVAAVFGPSRNLSHVDADERADAVKYLMACIDFAVAVDARIVSGPMYAVTGVTAMMSEAERTAQRNRAAESLRMAADYAASRQVSLAIEPLNKFETDLINTAEQVLELCSAVGRDNVGVTLDTFHMNIEEKSPSEAISMVGDRLLSFQASESDRGIVGSGNVRWAEVFTALERIQFSGPIVVESFDSSDPAIASMVSLWRPVAESMDVLASESIEFLRGAVTATSG